MNMTSIAAESQRQHQVGEFVQVAILGDCVCDDSPHYLGEIGANGRIIRAPADPSDLSHAYLVMFTEPLHVIAPYSGHVEVRARYYAADELEPLA
jgi:hypothetical protein